MTPKEKATWIVHQMYGALFHTNAEPAHVKQCALILVNEMLDDAIEELFAKKIKYWQEVKKEIEKI